MNVFQSGLMFDPSMQYIRYRFSFASGTKVWAATSSRKGLSTGEENLGSGCLYLLTGEFAFNIMATWKLTQTARLSDRISHAVAVTQFFMKHSIFYDNNSSVICAWHVVHLDGMAHHL